MEIDARFDLAEWGRRSEEFPMLRCVVVRGCGKVVQSGMFGGYRDRRTARGTWQSELRRHATVRKGCVKRKGVRVGRVGCYMFVVERTLESFISGRCLLW